jgi:hypothetical protein
LNLLTPASVHAGAASRIQKQLQTVLTDDFAPHPERFSLGLPIVKGAPVAVWINPPQSSDNLL